MLGPMPEAHGDACYVRSNGRGTFFSCYVRSVSGDYVMLGPIAEALFFPCYVRSVSGDFVMLGQIAESL